MVRVKVTNVIKLATLFYLYQKPMHGYDLIKRLGAKMERNISASQVYPFLKLLSKNGFVKSDIEGSRDKRRYTLTLEGKNFVKSTISRLGDIIDVAVTDNLSKCAHCGCTIYKGGYRMKMHGKSRVFCCRYCARECR